MTNQADGINPETGQREVVLLRHDLTPFYPELEFPLAFRQSRRDGKPRGIVKIRHGGES